MRLPRSTTGNVPVASFRFGANAGVVILRPFLRPTCGAASLVKLKFSAFVVLITMKAKQNYYSGLSVKKLLQRRRFFGR